MNRIIRFVTLVLVGALAVGSSFARAADVGDGGDDDPTTFSFFRDSRVAPLRDAKGRVLEPENVPTDYGVHYAILADGMDVCSRDYAWCTFIVSEISVIKRINESS